MRVGIASQVSSPDFVSTEEYEEFLMVERKTLLHRKKLLEGLKLSSPMARSRRDREIDEAETRLQDIQGKIGSLLDGE